jgi:hypothetical protein
MRSATGVLPSSFLSAPRISARMWLALAAGLGCGVCGYAGLYPRFDEGALRLIVALTCVPFAAAVVAASVSAQTSGRAFGRAVVLAALLGMAVTVIPAAIVTQNRSLEFVPACFFGAFFGAFTGAFYGIPLAILSSLGHRYVHVGTHSSTDRAARVAGVWLFAIALVGLAGTHLFDGPRINSRMNYETDMMIEPSRWPAFIACVVGLSAVVIVVRAITRLNRRTAWIERVRSGLEPAFRLRARHPRDVIAGLPRLSDGTTVVEWYPAEVPDVNAGSAYRMAAAGVAVAVVEDRPLTV